MTIIIIIVIIYIIIAESGPSSRSSKDNDQVQTPQKTFKSSEHFSKDINELFEKLKEKEEYREILSRHEKLEPEPEPEPEPELSVNFERNEPEFKPVEVSLPKHQVIEGGGQETTAQEVIREFKKRNITSLWHMTHKDNVASILKNGFKSHSEIFKQGGAVDISNQSVQALRNKPDPIYNRPLHDYVPTYFNIRNPMLFFKRDCNEDICLLKISIDCLADGEFVFTDGNAAAFVTRFFNKSKNIEELPWDVLSNEYWTDFEDGKRKRCAEVLVYPAIKLDYIERIYCYSASTFLDVANPDFKFEISSDMYF